MYKIQLKESIAKLAVIYLLIQHLLPNDTQGILQNIKQ